MVVEIESIAEAEILAEKRVQEAQELARIVNRNSERSLTENVTSGERSTCAETSFEAPLADSRFSSMSSYRCAIAIYQGLGNGDLVPQSVHRAFDGTIRGRLQRPGEVAESRDAARDTADEFRDVRHTISSSLPSVTISGTSQPSDVRSGHLDDDVDDGDEQAAEESWRNRGDDRNHQYEDFAGADANDDVSRSHFGNSHTSVASTSMVRILMCIVMFMIYVVVYDFFFVHCVHVLLWNDRLGRNPENNLIPM